MNKLPLIAAMAFGLAAYGHAQDQVPAHAPDGRVRERLESIMISPQPNAPFTATVTTEWTKILPDDSTQTIWNHRTVARDSSGRVFEERRYFTPDGDKRETLLQETDFTDPIEHVRTVCFPMRKMCNQYNYMPQGRPVDRQMTGTPPNGKTGIYSGPPQPNQQAMSVPTKVTLPHGQGTIEREDLGQKSIEGLDALGSREVTTINAGVMGNQKAEPIIKEFWYSPRLGINLETKRFDPRTGKQEFVVSSINTAEPDAKMFVLPAGYRMVPIDMQ